MFMCALYPSLGTILTFTYALYFCFIEQFHRPCNILWLKEILHKPSHRSPMTALGAFSRPLPVTLRVK